jgi:5'-nucleotidase
MLNWSDVDTVMFDMDGTLLDLHFDNYFWEQLVPTLYGKRIGLSADEAWAHIHEQYQAMQGTLNWYCVDFWSEKLQMDLQQLKEQTRHKIALRPNVTPFLERLRAHDKKVLLVTNAHPGSLALKMEHTGLDVHFDRIISSHTLGKAKEHDGFWRTLQSIEHYEPERAVLFDDNLLVLRQARNEGIRYLFAIEQPDSQRTAVVAEELILIRDFTDIMPPVPIQPVPLPIQPAPLPIHPSSMHPGSLFIPKDSEHEN